MVRLTPVWSAVVELFGAAGSRANCAGAAARVKRTSADFRLMSDMGGTPGLQTIRFRVASTRDHDKSFRDGRECLFHCSRYPEIRIKIFRKNEAAPLGKLQGGQPGFSR